MSQSSTHLLRLRQRRGLTLAELLVAIALLGVGILGLVGSFNGIHKAIQQGKAATLASNLAQEKMQIIMQKSYYEILVTTAPAYDTRFSPPLAYDPGFFAPETILEGGISFTRLTCIQVVQENSGAIQVLAPTTSDTGMRQISVNIVWLKNGEPRKFTIQSIINNPNTVMANAVMQGRVTNATTGASIQSALVNAAENVGWRDTSNATGNYSMTLSPGTFNFVASAQGYYSRVTQASVAPNATATLNFSLTPIASGTVQGTVWKADHLLISNVVASTGSSNSWEYVELYNPTTGPIFIGDNTANGESGNPMPGYIPVLWGTTNASYHARHLYYINSTVPSNGFYLITNTGNADPATSCANITITGVSITPDACWRHVPFNAGGTDHAIQCGASCPGATSPDAGGVTLLRNGGVDSSYNLVAGWQNYVSDSVGWNQSSAGNAAPSNAVETTAITPISGNGLQPSEQLVRASHPGALSSSAGRAYDSGTNSLDFFNFAALTIRPYNTSNIYPPRAGTPLPGTIVSINDGLSAPSSATLVGSPPYAQFTIPGVATGTWVTFLDSGTLSAEVSNVIVTALATTSIPNAATTPAWPTGGAYSTILSSIGVMGTISGRVTDVIGGIITPAIVVNVGGANTTVGANGYYSVRMPTGTYSVVANQNNANATYETSTQPSVAVTLGDVTQNIDFRLVQGGRISGYITRDGTNPLPGVSVIALDSNGAARDTQVSGNNGLFTLINLTTGTYSVQPVLDSKENASPTTTSVVVTAGNTVSAGTFTVTGAMGTVTGSVTVSGSPIASGVLVIVSTASINIPPNLSSASLTGAAYYLDSSHEDGTYSLEVRGSSTTTYTAKGYYMYLNNQTPVISSRTVSGITVTAGQTTSGVNFAW